MPSLRQERLAKELVLGKPNSKYQAMVASGYDKVTALKNAKRTVESVGVKQSVSRLERGVRDNARDLLARALTTVGTEVDKDVAVALAAAKILPGVIEKIGEDGALSTADDRNDYKRALLRGICKGIVLGIASPDRAVGVLSRTDEYMAKAGLGRLSLNISGTQPADTKAKVP